jgi:tetratricopeptide (TPR) repeat protein/predicted Ser/Thr protein kinase
MGDLVGQSLAHFRILAKLGEGGMGVVYEAMDESLRRKVALKVLPDSFAQDEDRRRRFLREARSAAAITHANIATVHEVGEADGHVFIAMELVEGETLRVRLERGVKVAEAARIATEIARGLARAHDRGIIHRDLKPENVMITRHDEVKILDFGLAKLREEQVPSPSALEQQETATQLTREGRLLGTPGYMSPEQARGADVDARTDVFAFGVVLYEMVTSERPFVGDTTHDVLVAVARDPPRRASEKNADVSAAADRVIERCLEKLRDARYANGQEVLEALGAAFPEPRISEAGGARKEKSAPTVSLLTPGASVVAARRRSRWPWGLLLLAALAARGLGLRYGGGGASPQAPSEASADGSASDAPAAGVLTLINQPPPPTKVAEAAQEYALGMGALHDDNGTATIQHFERAVELDSTMAAAHFRAAIAYFSGDASPERIRAEFARATELRAQLSERDQALLDALEPVLHRARPDPKEATRRVTALSKSRPLDVELFDWLGWLCLSCPETREATERAIALDPSDANARQMQGISLAFSGRLDDARASFERCTALSLATSDCLASEAWTDMLAGHCADFESDARRTRDRSEIYGHALLTSALVSTGRPAAAAREESALLTAALPEPDRKLARLGLDTQLALIAGDFAEAEVLAAQEAAALAAHAKDRSERTPHYRLTMQLLTAALETGDTRGASQIAEDFVARSESWSSFPLSNNGVDLSVFIARLAPGDFEARRRERIDAWLAARAHRGLVWTYAFAAPASTPEEARAALDAMPSYAPITSYVNSMWLYLADIGIPDAAIGHVYLLAGKPDEALPYLKRAVAACADFDAVLAHTRAALDLGTALEATMDPRGACIAYKAVLDRWGHAKPRSVTADKARERAKALVCPP